MSSGPHVNNKSGREISAVDYLNREYLLRIVEALNAGEGNPDLAAIISDILVLKGQAINFDNRIVDLRNRFPKPEDFGIVFDAYLNPDGKTLQPGFTDNCLAINVYHLACFNAGVEPKYPKLRPNRGAYSSGKFWYYGEGQYSGTTIFCPLSASASAQVNLGEDRISADRKTVTFYNQPPGKAYNLFINGASSGISSVRSDVSGTVSFSYPAGIPVGAAISYTSSTLHTWGVDPDPADVGTVPPEELRRWAGAIKGGSRVYGLVGRKGQCLTFDTGQQIMLGRGGARGTPTVTAGNPAIFTQANHGLANGRLVTMAPATGGSLPNGFTSKTYYYVVNATTNTYQLALTPGGAGVAATTAGSSVQTSAPDIVRAGDVFQVDSDKGDISPPLYLDWATELPAARTFDATISQGSPAVFTKNAHGLVNGDAIKVLTTGTLPVGAAATPFVRDRFYFVINATANTFNISSEVGGTPVVTTSAGSGVHTIQAPLIAWTEGVFTSEVLRDRLTIEPHPVVLVGAAGSPRETVGNVTRSNTTIYKAHIKGQPEGLTATLLSYGKCVNIISEECHLYDSGVDNTNYGINHGLVGNFKVKTCYFRGVRRSWDSHRSKLAIGEGGSLPCGLGGHFLQSLSVFGGFLGCDNEANPQLMQYTGGDVSFVGLQMAMSRPALSLLNMRQDYCNLGGRMTFSGTTTIIDLDSYRDNETLQILDLAGPATVNDSLVDTEWPQTIVVDKSNHIIVRGKKLNREIYLFRVAKGFGPIMQRRQKAPLSIEFSATWDIEDQTVRDAIFLRADYNNTDQFYGPGCNIKIENVPEIYVQAIEGSPEGVTKIEGRSYWDINSKGRIKTNFRQGGFRGAKITGNLDLMELSVNRAYPQGDEGVSVFDGETGIQVDTVFSSGGVDANNKMICPRDKLIMRVNASSATVFDGVNVVFPKNPKQGQRFSLQTNNTMNNTVYDGNGVAIVGAAPVNLTGNQTITFVASKNRSNVLEWVYLRQV